MLLQLLCLFNSIKQATMSGHNKLIIAHKPLVHHHLWWTELGVAWEGDVSSATPFPFLCDRTFQTAAFHDLSLFRECGSLNGQKIECLKKFSTDKKYPSYRSQYFHPLYGNTTSQGHVRPSHMSPPPIFLCTASEVHLGSSTLKGYTYTEPLIW